MKHDPLKLYRRIQVAYMAITGLPHPYGAQAWAAKRLKMTPRVLRRWCLPLDAGGADPTVRKTGRWKLTQFKRLEGRIPDAARKRAVARLNKFERERPDIEVSKQAYFRSLGLTMTEVRDG